MVREDESQPNQWAQETNRRHKTEIGRCRQSADKMGLTIRLLKPLGVY